MAEPGRLIALVLTRAAAGLGGALGGIGLVHLIYTANPWAIPVLLVGIALLLWGVRTAARMARRDRGER